MANFKISALSSATTPLSGTEIVALVQSGSTKKVAVSYISNVAAGSNSQVQYNNAGVLAGSSNLVFDGTSLLVGTTSTTLTSGGFYLYPGANSELGVGHASGSPDGATFCSFRYANTPIGSITQSGTTAVAYNTSSDYRLKNSIAPMQNALAKVAALKPVIYKWNADGSDGEGFIAHELAEVCPHAVTGKKDAVNEDGSIKSQGIDTSFLVATLTAAIQEQQVLIQSLTDRIIYLESK